MRCPPIPIMGGEETFFVIRPVDPSKMVPKLAGV